MRDEDFFEITKKAKNDNNIKVIDRIREMCNEILRDCSTGKVLGVNWHGGMTPEEWQERENEIHEILKIIDG